jgi:hypothetical protein
MPEHFDLETFRSKHFDYRAGHHAAFFGPTQQAGKTTTAFALLEAVAGEELPATVLCKKHTDRVVSGWTRRLGFRETPSWPPAAKLAELPPFGHKPAGYTLWPPQTLTDPTADNLRLAREFTAAIVHNRKNRPSITFADELYGLLAELNQPKEGFPMRTLLTSVITQDSGSGHGLWFATQKPSGTAGVSIPGFFFNSAEHMFLSKDGEERNRTRYGEIACGIDPREIERETLKLAPFSWLYIRRTGPQWAIVDAYDESLKV